MRLNAEELDRFANLSKSLPDWLWISKLSSRVQAMIDMDVLLFGGVGLTNGGHGFS